MPSTERRPRRIDLKLPPSGGGSTADAATTEPVPPALPAPLAPSGLVAGTPFVVYSTMGSTSAVSLSWYPPPGLPPESYDLEWALDSGFTDPTLRQVPRGQTTGAVSGMPVSPVGAPLTAYFRVRARQQGVPGAWSNTASVTLPEDSEPPDPPTNLTYDWNGATGDLTLLWDNPTSANFRRVRVRIYASDGGAILHESYGSGRYVWLKSDHQNATGSAYDPSVYVVLTAFSWNDVPSATDLTGTATLAAPGTPAGLAHTWTSDDGTADETLRITWTKSADVALYRLTIDGITQPDIPAAVADYEYAYARNQADHSGTADPALSLSLIAVDALGQVSAIAATATATNAAPPATTMSVLAGSSSIGYVIAPSTARDLKDYEVKVYLNGGGVAVDTFYPTAPNGTYTIGDGTGSYQFTVAPRDLFGQVATASALTSAVSLIDWEEFVEGVRSGLTYTNSLGTAPATLAGLKDGDVATNVVTYSGGSGTWAWTQGDWGYEITHERSEFAASATVDVYLATSSDGATWTYHYGGTPAGGRWDATSSTATEATARLGAVSLAPGTWAIALALPRRCRHIRVYTRRLVSGDYSLREFFPSTLIRGTYIEAESITTVQLAASAVKADNVDATSFVGFEFTGVIFTGGTLQTTAQEIIIDDTGIDLVVSTGTVSTPAVGETPTLTADEHTVIRYRDSVGGNIVITMGGYEQNLGLSGNRNDFYVRAYAEDADARRGAIFLTAYGYDNGGGGESASISLYGEGAGVPSAGGAAIISAPSITLTADDINLTGPVDLTGDLDMTGALHVGTASGGGAGEIRTKRTITTNALDSYARFSLATTNGSTTSLGGAIDFMLESSTTEDRHAGRLLVNWVTNTDASRAGRVTLNAVDAAGVREGLRIEASGSEPKTSVNGAATVARQTAAAAAADLASAITLANSLRTILINFGIAKA